MKAVLICPAERPAVEALYERVPLVLVRMLGKCVIDYWMEHLAAQQYAEVLVFAADRPELVREHVGEGERWGIKTSVFSTTDEVNVTDWLKTIPAAEGATRIEVIDFLPGLSGYKLFTGYQGWFEAMIEMMPQSVNETRVGIHELQPGIWTSMHDAISPEAQLVPPCWIGKDVKIEAGAVIGPLAIIEDGVCVERGAEITESVIMSGTLVGECTEIRKSAASADTLVHLPDGVVTRVPDDFLLASLETAVPATSRTSWTGRLVAAGLLVAIAPFACLAMTRAMFKEQVYLRAKVAVRSCTTAGVREKNTIQYFEVPSRYGWIRRWPQLWDAVCGRFALIGNRPLTPDQAADLKLDFEKLWLAAPTGVIALADVETGIDMFGARARAHSCYYTVKGSWRMDLSIFFAVVIGRPITAIRTAIKDLMPAPVRYAELDGQG